MFDNGGEGSAATTAATPTTPEGVPFRVRQVVPIPIRRRCRCIAAADYRQISPNDVSLRAISPPSDPLAHKHNTHTTHSRRSRDQRGGCRSTAYEIHSRAFLFRSTQRDRSLLSSSSSSSSTERDGAGERLSRLHARDRTGGPRACENRAGGSESRFRRCAARIRSLDDDDVRT